MFNIKIDNQPEKFLKKYDDKLMDRFIKKIDLLKNNPFPRDAKRILNKNEKTFRIRIGDYRVLYVVFHEIKEILISKIDKRSRVYD
jgi:mRNA interferase RelE/StbE